MFVDIILQLEKKQISLILSLKIYFQRFHEQKFITLENLIVITLIPLGILTELLIILMQLQF